MNAALKAIVVPRLRALGFQGSFPHFRRLRADSADLLVFQFNKYGGSFVIEVAALSEVEIQSHWRADLTLSTATVYDARRRHRLGERSGEDHWIAFGKQNDEAGHEHVEPPQVYERIAVRAATLVESAGGLWWSGSNPAFEPTPCAAGLLRAPSKRRG